MEQEIPMTPEINQTNTKTARVERKVFKTSDFNVPCSSTPLKKRKTQLDEENVSPKQSCNEEVLGLLKQIISKQEALEKRMSKHENELMAHNKLLCECKVSLTKIEASVCRMTGETKDDHLDAIASTLPFSSIAAVYDMEEKLKTEKYTQGMTTYLHKLKGVSDDVDAVVRQIFMDKVLVDFNWEGRWGKRPLANLILVERILSDVFQSHGVNRFQKEAKRSIELSHNRFKQRKFHGAKSNPPPQ